MAVGGVLVNEKGYFSDPLYGKIGYEVLFWQGRQAGEKLKVSVLREGKKKSLTVTVKPIPWKDYLIYWSHDKKPRYFVMGGMVFQEVTYNYLETYGSSWRKNAGARLVHLESSMGRNPPEDRPHLVVLSRILRDKINEGYGDLTGSIVETVNGQSVKDLDHFVAIIEASNDKFVHLGFSGNLEVVMETQELKKRDPEILKVHKISKDRRL